MDGILRHKTNHSRGSGPTAAANASPIGSPLANNINTAHSSTNGSNIVERHTLLHKWDSYPFHSFVWSQLHKKKLIFCGTQDSKILVYDMINYSLKYEVNCGQQNHASSVLTLTISADENHLFSAGSDSLVKVYDFLDEAARYANVNQTTLDKHSTVIISDGAVPYQHESKLRAVLSVKIFKDISGCTYLLSGVRQQPAKPTRVLWYAHYDVVDATNHEAADWGNRSVLLTARDGNLYARGVSDNKGPILASIYAVADLFSREELSCDVVFIIEGEEECGSIGFQKVINESKSPLYIDW
ncbi:hypothetical protein G9P44_005136 [Scheffersomyces stipitis]|nr:hypothetical protein G9P44_005136 [Scheffersomyces stipitis]